MTPRVFLIAGAVLVALALIAIPFAPAAVLNGWLAAALLWSGWPAASLGLLLIARLVPGRWSHPLAPWWEAGAATLPIAALAALPVLGGMAWLYPWWDAPTRWLAPVPFAVRTLLWFGGLGAVTLGIVRRRGGTPLAIGGLIFVVLMGSLIAVDWGLSLDPAFHSSGFGLQMLIVWFTLALAGSVLGTTAREPTAAPVIGGVLLTAALLWCYLQFMPFLIAWSGNTPDAAGWYGRRGGGWAWLVGGALAAHVGAAAALVLPACRGSTGGLRAVATVLALGEALWAAWIVLPEARTPVLAGLVSVTATVGLGLLLTATTGWMLRRRVEARTA